MRGLGGRRHHRRPEIDIGDEPALIIEGRTRPDRRSVSVRWLVGAVLIGCVAGSMMGGALWTALDGQQRLASDPTLAAVADAQHRQIIGKSARLKSAVNAVTNKRVIQLSAVTRVGDRDFIKLRPFVRASASLATHLANDPSTIPPFNPLAVATGPSDADSAARAPETSPGAAGDALIFAPQADGDISVAMKPFPLESTLFDTSVELSDREVMAAVAEAARYASGGNIDIAAVDTGGDVVFGIATDAGPAGFDVHIVPENVSSVEKRYAQPDPYAEFEEKIVTVAEGNTLVSLLTENGATDAEAADAARAMAEMFDPAELKSGDKLRLWLGPAPEDVERLRPERVSLYSDSRHLVTVARTGKGAFELAEEPQGGTIDQIVETEGQGTLPNVYESLYDTALSLELPRPLINEIVHAISYDFDLHRKVSPGDSFQLLYAADTPENAEPELLHIAVSIGGESRRYYSFRVPGSNKIDYFDETGRSSRRFLIRKPVPNGTFTSAFGARRHPILGYVKIHTGVDWAAPRGTPIYAAGDGVVEMAQWYSGYGRYVRIRHNNGYETAYGHMSGFAKGIEPGAHVKLGQVIGYVGSTGLSTGPHCHFEILVNSRPVDPMRVRLPSGEMLKGPALAAFEAERKRIDAVMAADPSNPHLASTQ